MPLNTAVHYIVSSLLALLTLTAFSIKYAFSIKKIPILMHELNKNKFHCYAEKECCDK